MERHYNIDGKKYRRLRSDEKFDVSRILTLIEVEMVEVRQGDCIEYYHDFRSGVAVVLGITKTNDLVDEFRVSDYQGGVHRVKAKDVSLVRRDGRVIWGAA